MFFSFLFGVLSQYSQLDILWMKHGQDIGASKPNTSLRYNIKESVKIVVKFLGISVWLVIFAMTLLEVKQYYNIDVLPGVNTSVEDVHSMVFGGISKYF